jgi:hypothetical protein
MRSTDLLFTHAFFYQLVIARLMREGMWFSDAVHVLQIIWPRSTGELPDDWEAPYYDVTRKALRNDDLPIPSYKPIW